MPDQYEWWRQALKGNVGEITESDPKSGYYKMRDGHKNAAYSPVAIWINAEGVPVCRVGPNQRNPMDVWTWCAKNPVSKEDARHAFEHGSWPGDVPQSPTIGDNSGVLELPEEIDDAIEQAKSFLKSTPIDSKIAADKCKNWRDRIAELVKKADKQRDDEKRPHDAAAAAVQAKWKPYIDRGKQIVGELRSAPEAWLLAEDGRIKAEAKAKADAENARRMAEYEKQRKAQQTLEAQQNGRATDTTNVAGSIGELVPELTVPTFVAPETTKVQIGGQRGKRSGLKTETKWEVTDYLALLSHVKDHPDVIAAVEKVGRAQAKSGAEVPGMSAKTIQVAA